ncbi:UbiD family decarboxylase, partial [Lophium mytilinum]
MTDPIKVLAIESWTLYAVGIILIALRMVSRRMALGGFSKFQADDWIMAFIVITYTGDVISVNQVMQNGSNYLPPGVAESLSPQGVKNAIWGSKMTLALEEFQLSTTWLVKACLLFMYNRLTNGLPREHLIVKWVAGYCVFGYVLTQILYLGVWCHPITEYWRVPVKYPQCATYYNHLITSTVFNVSSDLIMLCIPIPLIAKTQLPLKRKIILYSVFSLGLFVVLTAILNRYYNFTQPYSPIFLNWYIGEASTAVYIANVPLLWPLLKSLFRLDTWSGSRGSRRTP